jgi:hypothetical protein
MNLKMHTPEDRLKVITYINNLPDGKTFEVDIKQKREIRSVPQNKLYWLWLSCIMNETGNDKIDLHKFFSEKYLSKNLHEVFGEQVERTISTTILDTLQFSQYLERIQQFANATLGIVLPNPEDLHFQEFYEQYRNFI